MASHVKQIFLLTILLGCLSHFGITYTLVPGIAVEENCEIPLRLEIRTFIQNSTRRNILLIALERMQEMSTDELLSYYKISGIHGTNFAWDNDTGGNYPGGFGYCYHGDRLFLPWHRPYLSLYEKTLLDLATEIVEGFSAGTHKNRHLGVLKTWRMPYWDWAMDASIPSIMSSKTVSVRRMVNGALQLITIPNPLSSYRLQIPDDPNVSINPPPPYTIQTVRNPIVRNDTYVTRAGRTNNQMIEWGDSMKESVGLAFINARNYTAFSHSQGGPFSIEGVHGTVHVIAGGSDGHMSYVNFAGFDPMFYLHHANVDRLFAMWQVLYPDSYIASDPMDSYDENTELHPFRKTDNQYWTPALCRNITELGYLYPEVVGFDVQTVIDAIFNYYNVVWSSSGRRKRALTPALVGITSSATSNPSRITSGLLNTITSKVTATATVGSGTRATVTTTRPTTTTRPSTTTKTTRPTTTTTITRPTTTTTITRPTTTTPKPNFSTSYNQYFAMIQMPSTVVNGPFLVCAFLGKPSSTESDCSADPNFAGLFGVFAPKGGFRSHKQLIQRAISLTNTLDERFGVKWTQDPQSEMIRGDLSSNLYLRIVADQNALFDKSNIQVDVVTAKMFLPSERNALPVLGSFDSIYKAAESDLASKVEFLAVPREIATVDEIDVEDSISWLDYEDDSETSSTIPASTNRPTLATVSGKSVIVSDAS